jgi:YD repeat-containing protein
MPSTRIPARPDRSTARSSTEQTLTLKNGTVYTFGDSDPTLHNYGSTGGSREAAVRTIQDRFGNSLTLNRDANWNLTNITLPSGRYVNLTYDTSNRVTQAIDNIGRVVSYVYDTGGRLSTVTDPSGNVETYTYDINNILSVIDKRANTKVTNTYDVNGRVSKQVYADGTSNSFAYTVVNNATTQGQLAVCMNQQTTLVGAVGQAYPASCTIGPDGMVAPTISSFRIVWFNHCAQRLPWHYAIHYRQKFITLGRFAILLKSRPLVCRHCQCLLGYRLCPCCFTY